MNTRSGFRKWVVCDPECPVSDAAYIALAGRLRCIPDLLKQAAKRADQDTEHVHRVRVATRRAAAALEVFGDFASSRPVKRLSRYLGEIRRAAGRARDLDVLIQRCAARDADIYGIDSLTRRRKRAQKRIVQAHRKFVKSGKFKKQFQRLMRSMPDLTDAAAAESFADWSHRNLSASSEKFFETWPPDAHDFEKLHAFRIQGKWLRYVIELVACACSDELRRDIYPQIESLQDSLGAINDHVVAIQKLNHWADGSGKTDAQRLHAELQQERLSLESAVQRFDQDWSLTARDNLRHQFRQILESPPPAELSNASAK